MKKIKWEAGRWFLAGVFLFFLFGDIYSAITATLIVCFVMLTVLGCYLGKIAKESMSKTAVEIIGVGVLIVIISFLMGGGHG